ncbi:MAG: DUF222 domain-containing protein, partial [Actinomycetota bacterium]|nr:DUF222 domain-containing protein [Actinomycetota bacterium]
YLSKLMEGRSDLKGNLDAESAEVLAVALRQAASDDVEGEPSRTPAHRRADALVDICRWFLTHRDPASSPRHRPHVNVVVDIRGAHPAHRGAQRSQGPRRSLPRRRHHRAHGNDRLTWAHLGPLR